MIRLLFIAVVILAVFVIVDARIGNEPEDDSRSGSGEAHVVVAKRFIQQAAETLHLSNRYKRHVRAIVRNYELPDGV